MWYNATIVASSFYACIDQNLEKGLVTLVHVQDLRL